MPIRVMAMGFDRRFMVVVKVVFVPLLSVMGVINKMGMECCEEQFCLKISFGFGGTRHVRDDCGHLVLCPPYLCCHTAQPGWTKLHHTDQTPVCLMCPAQYGMMPL